MYIIIVKSLLGRDSSHEHPKLPHLQIFWDMVNIKLIDYASLIWEDLVKHIQKGGEKIPFVRFTKLLIHNFLEEFDYIPQRLDDEDKHTVKNEPTLKMIKILGTSTRKQGIKLPDCLVTDKVKVPKCYKYYERALKEEKVGFLDEQPQAS